MSQRPDVVPSPATRAASPGPVAVGATLSRPAADPSDPLSPLRRDLGRYWLYVVWFALACLGAGGFWALAHGSAPATFVKATLYLLAWGAALFLPARLIAAGAVAARLSPRRHRAVLNAWFVVAAALAVGSIIAGRLVAAPLLILLIGNAIWGLDTQERETRRGAEPGAPEPAQNASEGPAPGDASPESDQSGAVPGPKYAG